MVPHSSNNPTRLLLPLLPLEHRQGVRLGIEHPLLERHELLLMEEQIQVFQRLCEEEAACDMLARSVWQ